MVRPGNGYTRSFLTVVVRRLQVTRSLPISCRVIDHLLKSLRHLDAAASRRRGSRIVHAYTLRCVTLKRAGVQGDSRPLTIRCERHPRRDSLSPACPARSCVSVSQRERAMTGSGTWRPYSPSPLHRPTRLPCLLWNGIPHWIDVSAKPINTSMLVNVSVL